MQLEYNFTDNTGFMLELYSFTGFDYPVYRDALLLYAYGAGTGVTT